MKKNTGNMSFAELALSKRKINTRFFDAVNAMIDWGSIEKVIDQFDTRGKRLDGNPCYAGLVLFKMSLLGIWYGLSDRELEDHVNDSISFTRFCGLSLEDSIPDHSIVSRFRNHAVHPGSMAYAFGRSEPSIARKRLLVRTGTIVDASIRESPLKPKQGAIRSEGDNEAVAPGNGHKTGPSFRRWSKALA
ncbi:MAG: transposase [Bacteroidetes bacterium]|nr:transposase [Bacteroidota bacterium]